MEPSAKMIWNLCTPLHHLLHPLRTLMLMKKTCSRCGMMQDESLCLFCCIVTATFP